VRELFSSLASGSALSFAEELGLPPALEASQLAQELKQKLWS
jgi:hypothetical protein